MPENFYNALDRYFETFNDNFPTMEIFGTSVELIEMISKCIEENKDVYDMGYLELNPNIYR